jgi:hypothetical protein
MKRCTLFIALMTVAFLPVVASAEAAPEGASVVASELEAVADTAAAADETDQMDWDQFDDPSFDPAVPGEDAQASEAATAARVASDQPSDDEVLNSVMGATPGEAKIVVETTNAPAVTTASGIDDEGRAGRLHTVAPGNTLWDLAAAYLGTPWVWPSVWIDNDDIANPHLILPGDKIWITANEMRVVTDAEAESFLVQADAAPVADETAPIDASIFDEAAPVAALDAPDEPSTLEAFPVSVLGGSSQAGAYGREITVAHREAMGFVTPEALEGASTIVGSSVERHWLAAGDPIVFGLGEGDVEVGDQFTIFTPIEEIRDPETLRLLGHHIEVLGWAEVKQLTGDTSLGEIRTSFMLIARGMQVMPREIPPRKVEIRNTPDAIEGKVIFLPADATVTGDGGYVYLNRGEFHGIEMGTALEVFEAGRIVTDRSRDVDVRTPDHLVARLVVVTVKPDSSVAFIVSSNRELAVGDTVRPLTPELAQR